MNFHDSFKSLNKRITFTEPPGTIKYTGVYKNVPVTIECIRYNKNRMEVETGASFKKPESDDHVYWYNITGLHDIELVKEVTGYLGMHSMDVEDIVHVSQWSKIEYAKDYLFSIMKMIYLKDDAVVHEHITIIRKDNILVTFQETRGDVFDEIRERLHEEGGRIRKMGAGYLYYALLDALVDNYYLAVGKVSDAFLQAETLVLDNSRASGDAVYSIRKEMHYLQNAITPVQTAINAFAQRDDNILFDNMKPYFDDLNEHVNHVSETLFTYKEMVKSLHDMHMANASNDMNKIMTTLTIFSAVFIPLSFLSGVFGMNFVNMPVLEYQYGFPVFGAACLAIAVLMLAFFKKQGWI